MGCLNSSASFEHVFGNIHLSGPCNRKCYFCIGQHMMALDPYNVLGVHPLPGLDDFMRACNERRVLDVNLTGTNTDPLLYRPLLELREALDAGLPGIRFGLRTNGGWLGRTLKETMARYYLFDNVALSIPSFDADIYRAMMGGGLPPSFGLVARLASDFGEDLKVNIVLGPENEEGLINTLMILERRGVRRVNLREPYGQPHRGDPLADWIRPKETRYGMPVYEFGRLEVMYWDVHYVEVESVNLYANGRVSSDYPITRGHDPSGEVKSQDYYPVAGRTREQWLASA